MIVPWRPALMRETSHPEVYLVYGGTKFWIQSPEALFALGFDWSKVQVIPDGTLDSCNRQTLDSTLAVKPSDVFWNARGSIFDPTADPYQAMMSKDPASIVHKNVIIAGWLASCKDNLYCNCWTYQNIPYVTEDYHYQLILDADFMMDLYGLGGLSTALNGISLPGNVSGGVDGAAPPLRFDDISEIDGSSRGVTMNSFALPHTGGALCDTDTPNNPLGYFDGLPNDHVLYGPVMIHVELNCWHVNDMPPNYIGRRWYGGRGPAPAGWVQMSQCNDVAGDAWWPFTPSNPDGGSRPLQAGDYVLMKGALVEEHAHDKDAPSLWRQEQVTLGHAGLLEMHPPDWITRVHAPPQPKTAFMVACCGPATSTGDDTYKGTSGAFIVPYPYPAATADPPVSSPPVPGATLQCLPLIDGRFTNLRFDNHSLLQTSSTVEDNHVQVKMLVQNVDTIAGTMQGRCKASYTVWWQLPVLVQTLPVTIPTGEAVTVYVHAEDGASGSVITGTVHINGVAVGSTDTNITFTFHDVNSTGTVIAPGYAPIPLTFGLVPGKSKEKEKEHKESKDHKEKERDNFVSLPHQVGPDEPPGTAQGQAFIVPDERPDVGKSSPSQDNEE